MSSMLAGATIAVIGGDDREVVLIPELVRMGADVRVAGIAKLFGNKSVQCFGKIEDAVENASFVILPMPGVDENGVIKAKYGTEPLCINRDTMQHFQEGSVIITGFARPLLKDLAETRGIKVIEIADMDEIAILNSIPSAEGAIQMAMEATDFTLHGSTVIVVGFGRCGITLARMIHGIGAKTKVAARKPRDLARIREMGLEPLNYGQLAQQIGEADIIFNTVPVVVLDRALLKMVKPGVYICDIASSPGGVDYAAAKELGINAVLAPGLPGKVAPKTAGLILAEVIPELIAAELTNTSSSSNDGLR